MKVFILMIWLGAPRIGVPEIWIFREHGSCEAVAEAQTQVMHRTVEPCRPEYVVKPQDLGSLP